MRLSDGSISVDEIASVMKLMGSDPTESEIRDMVNQVRDYSTWLKAIILFMINTL